MKGKLVKDIENTFGLFENFQQEFKQVTTKRFGSGWVWLIKDVKTGTSILNLWEHAYYLKYQNKRSEYIDNWWNVVNWDEIERRYLDSITN